MKTVRKCFLAMVSTVSISVAASGVLAQSLPGGQGFNFQNEASNAPIGSTTIYGGSPVRDANPRSSDFAPDGGLPFNAFRQQPSATARHGRPPVVRAPSPPVAQASRNAPPVESFFSPRDDQQIGLGPLPEVVPSSAVRPAPTSLPPGNQTPLASGPATNGYYHSAQGASSHDHGHGQSPGLATGYGQTPIQVQQASYPNPAMAMPQGAYPNPAMAMPQGAYPNPAMGMPQSGYSMPAMGIPQGPPPGMGFSQGPPQGNNWTMPAAYGAPQAFPGGIAATEKPGGPSACRSCGGNGCPNCGYGRGFGNGGGFMAGLLRGLLPYAEGGQCAPRWYDITLDAMYLAREGDVSRRVDFTADGPGPNPTIIMSTDDLKFEEQVGFRLNGAIQIFATATAEFTYYGLFDWSSSNSRADAMGGLFSPISQFATFPPLGFPQTDNAIFHSIDYSSTIDNFEMNLRRRFTAPNCRVQASVLAGVRYFYLLEDFRYFTEGLDNDLITPGNQAGTMDYNIRTRNSLTGLQVGADLWSSVVPGIKAGGEIKAGVFGNYANQTTSIVVTEPAASFLEDVDTNDVAIIADANLMVIWRVNPNWTIRAGYFLLYVDGVALAPEQFNSSAPPNLVNPSLRTQAANDNGTALYHGGFAGLEWMW